ncbi:hypothetical protein COP2_034759 [Malus domestica]
MPNYFSSSLVSSNRWKHGSMNKKLNCVPKIEALGLEVTKLPSQSTQHLDELEIANDLDKLSAKLDDMDEMISSAMAADPSGAGYFPKWKGTASPSGSQIFGNTEIEIERCGGKEKSSSFESFIYRALASKLHLQSFTYKASVQGIQVPPPNNHHFGPYMDSI